MTPRLWLMQPVWLHLSQMELTSTVAVPKGATTEYWQSDLIHFGPQSLLLFYFFLLMLGSKAHNSFDLLISNGKLCFSVFIPITLNTNCHHDGWLDKTWTCLQIQISDFFYLGCLISFVLVFSDGLCQPGMVHASSTSLNLWKTWSDMWETKWAIQTIQRLSK